MMVSMVVGGVSAVVMATTRHNRRRFVTTGVTHCVPSLCVCVCVGGGGGVVRGEEVRMCMP